MNFKIHIFISFYIMIIIYLSLSFLYGKTGVFAMEKLLMHREKVILNISELKKINQELGKKIVPLNEAEIMRLSSRTMGYLAADEKRIFIEGFGKTGYSQSLGRIIYRKDFDKKDNNTLIRWLSLISALLFFVTSAIFFPIKYGTKEKISKYNRENYQIS